MHVIVNMTQFICVLRVAFEHLNNGHEITWTKWHQFVLQQMNCSVDCMRNYLKDYVVVLIMS